MNNELKLLQQAISEKSVLTAKQILTLSDDFLSRFDRKDIFSFSTQSKQKQEQEKISEQYFLLLTSLSPLISELASLNAKLASLLIKADAAMDVELIAICEEKFTAFEAFERNSYEYISTMEGLLSIPQNSVSAIINATQKFKNSVNCFITINS